MFITWRQKPARHFTLKCIFFKKGNNNTKNLAYTSLVRPILEYRALCWDPFREGQINALDRVRKKEENLQILRMIRTGKRWRNVER
jgi:hypothetical protein